MPRWSLLAALANLSFWPNKLGWQCHTGDLSWARFWCQENIRQKKSGPKNFDSKIFLIPQNFALWIFCSPKRFWNRKKMDLKVLVKKFSVLTCPVYRHELTRHILTQPYVLNKLGLSCAKLRRASPLSLLLLVISELCKCENPSTLSEVNQEK